MGGSKTKKNKQMSKEAAGDALCPSQEPQEGDGPGLLKEPAISRNKGVATLGVPVLKGQERRVPSWHNSRGFPRGAPGKPLVLCSGVIHSSKGSVGWQGSPLIMGA